MQTLHPVAGFQMDEPVINEDNEKEKERDFADDSFVQLCI